MQEHVAERHPEVARGIGVTEEAGDGWQGESGSQGWPSRECSSAVMQLLGSPGRWLSSPNINLNSPKNKV